MIQILSWTPSLQLGTLVGARLVEKYEDGRYGVSERGKRFLAGEVGANPR